MQPNNDNHLPTYDLSTAVDFFDYVRGANTIDSQKYFNSKYIVKNCDETLVQYELITYDKSVLSHDRVPTYGLLRSIIMQNNRIVSFAPPKSIDAYGFMETHTADNQSAIVAEEFVDGTMINVFMDRVLNKWTIATKNTVGCDTSFFKDAADTSPSFKTMFDEALSSCKFSLDLLNPDFCYSFVLQHPCNRIVVPISTPQLYLCEYYKINHVDNASIKIVAQDLDICKQNPLWAATCIKYPQRYPFTSFGDSIRKYASINTSYTIMGVVFKDRTTGTRAHVRNPNYEEVRHLRGNQPKLLYHYLCLRRMGKVPLYLKYYPEKSSQLSQFRGQVHAFTHALHEIYVDCFIKKKTLIGDCNDQFKPHMHNLHRHYIRDLMPDKRVVTISEVITYVNQLQPQYLMHSLNYHIKQHFVDVQKTAHMYA